MKKTVHQMRSVGSKPLLHSIESWLVDRDPYNTVDVSEIRRSPPGKVLKPLQTMRVNYLSIGTWRIIPGFVSG